MILTGMNLAEDNSGEIKATAKHIGELLLTGYTARTSVTGDISATESLKASSKSKPADVAIQKADRKVQNATYSVDKIRQEITEAIAQQKAIINKAQYSIQGAKKAFYGEQLMNATV